MNQNESFAEKEIDEMKNTIDFRKYGKSNEEYTLEELVEIYKKITADIQNGKA